MPKQKTALRAFQAKPKSYGSQEEYISSLDPLLKKNLGQSTNIGFNVDPTQLVWTGGRVADPTGLGQLPPSARMPEMPDFNQQVSNPIDYSQPDIVPPQLNNLDQVSPDQDITQATNINWNIGNLQQSGQMPGVDDGYDYAAQPVTQIYDGGIMHSDGTVRYDDGSYRVGAKQSGAQPIQSMADGSIRYSDGSIMRPANYAEQMAAKTAPIASVLTGQARYLRPDNQTFIAPYIAPGDKSAVDPSMIPDMSRENSFAGSPVMSPYSPGELPLSSANYDFYGGTQKDLGRLVFGGREQKINQDYGNPNPMYRSGYHSGIDYETRSLPSDFQFQLPVNARVVKVSPNINAKATPYGNSVVVDVGNGKMLRFSHLNEIADIKEGQELPAGSPIGTPGSTGHSTGQHLDLTIHDIRTGTSKAYGPEHFGGLLVPKKGALANRPNVQQKTSPTSVQPLSEATNPAVETLLDNLGLKGQARDNARKSVPMIAKSLKDEGILDDQVLAYAIATMAKESAGTMAPVREAYWLDVPGSEGEAGKREAAQRGYSGGDNYYGRGVIQLTHDYNYKKYGERIGMGDQLLKNPDLALDPTVSAKVLAAYFKDRGVANAVRSGDMLRARGLVQGFGKAHRETEPQVTENYKTTLQSLAGQDVQALAPSATSQNEQPMFSPAQPVTDITPQPLRSEPIASPAKPVTQPLQSQSMFSPAKPLSQPMSSQATIKPQGSIEPQGQVLGVSTSEPYLGDIKIPGADILDPNKALAQPPQKFESPYKSTPEPKQTAQSGTGVEALKISSPGPMQSTPGGFQPDPMKAGAPRSIGEQTATSSAVVQSSMLDPKLTAPKNDTRDPFFKQGGAEMFSSSLAPGIDKNYRGALTMDLFKPSFYENSSNISTVFGASKDLAPATEKFKAYEAAKYPKQAMNAPAKMSGVDYQEGMDRGEVEKYNQQVGQYNAQIDQYINAINQYNSQIDQYLGSITPGLLKANPTFGTPTNVSRPVVEKLTQQISKAAPIIGQIGALASASPFSAMSIARPISQAVKAFQVASSSAKPAAFSSSIAKPQQMQSQMRSVPTMSRPSISQPQMQSRPSQMQSVPAPVQMQSRPAPVQMQSVPKPSIQQIARPVINTVSNVARAFAPAIGPAAAVQTILNAYKVATTKKKK